MTFLAAKMNKHWVNIELSYLVARTAPADVLRNRL